MPLTNLEQLLDQIGLRDEQAPSLEQWQTLLKTLRGTWPTTQMQEAVREDDAPDLVLDAEGRIVLKSDTLKERLGWREAFIGRDIAEMLSSPLEGLRIQSVMRVVWQNEDARRVLLPLRTGKDTMQICEALASRRAAGEGYHVEMRVTRSTPSFGIHDAGRVDQAHFYEQLFMALPSPLAILNRHRRYAFCNVEAIRSPEVREWILGKTDEEYGAYRGFDPALAAQREHYMDIALTQRQSVQFEEAMTTPKGETVYQHRTYTPVFHPGGDLLLYLGHGLNVTELRRTQEALRELNAELEERVRERTADLEAATRQLQHDALHDTLTGLPNRALFSDRLDQAMARAAQPGGPQYSVLFLDIDRFKGINDTLGHPSGDLLLIEVGQRLRSCLRSTDTVARLGGDEFTILLEPLLEANHAQVVAERIQEELRRPAQLAEQRVAVSASIGIVHNLPDYTSATDVLRDADIAMYHAKDAGRGGHQVFSAEMREQALHVSRVESELRQALSEGELRVMYQPVLDLAHGRIEGFEALVRWQHPERGLLGAGEFTAIAENTGLLPDIDRWVLREACTQMQRWKEQYPEDPLLSVSVNFCGKNLTDPKVSQYVERVLQETGLDPRCLKIEITESTLLLQSPELRRTMEHFKALGVGLHLDDFGTGYSSLSYLQHYPLDALKIDRSFVQGMLEHSSSAELVRTIIAMAKNMNLYVVAEGVENAGQLQALREQGCGYGQGYLFSRPLDVAEARALVVQGQHFLRASWGYGDDRR